MKNAGKFLLVLVTAPKLNAARKIASAALEARLVACANLVPGISSYYWWQGKIELASEVLIIFKTTRSQLAKLEMLILARHPYDTPEIVAMPLATGTDRYLAWISSSMSPAKESRG